MVNSPYRAAAKLSQPGLILRRVLYRRGIEVERYCCRLKRFRRIASWYDELELVFLSFIYLALIEDARQLL